MNTTAANLLSGNKKAKSQFSKLLRILIVVLVDVALIWFTYQLIRNGFIPLAIVFTIITLFITYVFFRQRAYPLRWMAIGLSAMLLFSIFPILYTVYVAFTNYGDSHLLSKPQAIQQLEKEKYLPEEGKAYKWVAFRSEDESYILWVEDVNGSTYLAKVGEPLQTVVAGENGVGDLDDKGIPISIDGYKRLNPILAATDKNLTQIRFGEDSKAIQVRSPSEAAELLPLYLYDETDDIIINQDTGVTYIPVKGTFTSTRGEALIPGFRGVVGFENFTRFLTSSALKGPLALIVSWNFAFAFLSVFLTFSLGLAISIFYGDPKFPGKKLLRSLLLVPYTIPSLITILIWRGMMNPQIGVLNNILNSLFGISPEWFTNQWLAKIAILIVNLWLGYPYFMLVTSGALQSIPLEIYQAAEVDGASAWQRFWRITLPLLLVSVGPLLIASFIFNFNNFNLIYLFIGGGPPIPGASTRAGYTDILISYVYNLAFEGGRGVNYGFASAISIFIFILIAILSLLQFRLTNMWEEVGENV